MRPVVIYIKENGKLDITKEKLDEMLRDAYNQGYDDGKRAQWWNYPYWNGNRYYYGVDITCTSNSSGRPDNVIYTDKNSYTSCNYVPSVQTTATTATCGCCGNEKTN